ncbi:hypothetical protein BV22DRAFT_1050246 [Leucogyrophana mollusca]|uniref:Uncharacterized protein n=1 Tax=Leucogyrophana mollusca TaxID=85980 RepID=A0ACB8B484_9AGAM|nr:hypothetical protein BV22DRAFT_1050246 [Leucogyrophana mollusca]
MSVLTTRNVTYPLHKVHSAYYVGALRSSGRITIHSEITSAQGEEWPLFLYTYFPDVACSRKHYFCFFEAGFLLKTLVAYYNLELQREDPKRAPYLIIGLDDGERTFLNLSSEDIMFVAYAVDELAAGVEMVSEATETSAKVPRVPQTVGYKMNPDLENYLKY